MKWWKGIKDPDFSGCDMTEEMIQNTLKRIEYQQFQASSKNDWVLFNDLKLAAECIKVLWTRAEKLEWQVKHGVTQVQTPDD